MSNTKLTVKEAFKQWFDKTPSIVLATIGSIMISSGFLIATGVAYGIPVVNTLIHMGIVSTLAVIYCLVILRKDSKELTVRKDGY